MDHNVKRRDSAEKIQEADMMAPWLKRRHGLDTTVTFGTCRAGRGWSYLRLSPGLAWVFGLLGVT